MFNTATLNFDMTVTKFIPVRVDEVFSYWTHSELMEQWNHPDGMEVKVSQFEAYTGGRYHLEHSNSKDTLTSVGFIKQIIPNEKLILVDLTVKNASGKLLHSNLESVAEFERRPGGTLITVTQKGFADRETSDASAEVWSQKLDHLAKVFEAPFMKALTSAGVDRVVSFDSH